MKYLFPTTVLKNIYDKFSFLLVASTLLLCSFSVKRCVALFNSQSAYSALCLRRLFDIYYNHQLWKIPVRIKGMLESLKADQIKFLFTKYSLHIFQSNSPKWSVKIWSNLTKSEGVGQFYIVKKNTSKDTHTYIHIVINGKTTTGLQIRFIDAFFGSYLHQNSLSI